MSTKNSDELKKQPSRIDGRAKVMGKATYIAEFRFPDLAYGYLVHSTIAKGKITEIDSSAAEKEPGVVKVLTHKNVQKLASFKPDEEFGEGSKPFFALMTDTVLFSGQPVAMVVADTLKPPDMQRHWSRSRTRPRFLRPTLRRLPIKELLREGRDRFGEPLTRLLLRRRKRSRRRIRFLSNTTMRWNRTQPSQIGPRISSPFMTRRRA